MKIMFIDDDPLIGRLAQKMLEGAEGVEGMVVDVHSAGEDFIRKWAARKHDVVLSDYDLGLGHLNGLDVLRLAPAGCRRVLMSGDPPADTSPADVVLEKPFTREQLFSALGIGEESAMTPNTHLWMVVPPNIIRCRVLEISKSGATAIVRSTRSDGKAVPEPTTILLPHLARNVFRELPDAVAFLVQSADRDVQRAKGAYEAAKRRRQEVRAEIAAWDWVTATDTDTGTDAR